jgi:hypothetical protein
MTQVRHRKEHKTRASKEPSLASNLELEGTSSFQSNTPNVSQQNLRKSLAQPNTGQSLDPNLKAELEPQFGHSFGDVRVHTELRFFQESREE